MTAIDRTIYRRMKRSYTPKELIEAYTPTEEERRFVSTMTRTAQNQLNLMLWLKLFPCLGYFPALDEIPPALVEHVRQALDLAAEVVPGYDHDRTFYRHHQVVREYYQILPYAKEARRVILRTLLRAVRTMDNPADMINAALEELIKQRFELPAFSTLDRLTGRVRALVYGRISRMVQRRMTADMKLRLEALFEVQLPSHRSAFSQLKQVPPSPTLSHLKVWQDRLAWLMELGAMEPLLKDIPPAIIKHFAAEARALDASELQDYELAKCLTLLTCLIRQTQMSTQDDLIDMFLKRMSTIQVRAKEALQLAREAQQKTTAQLVETLTQMVETAVEDKEQDDATAGRHLREILEKQGGEAQLLEQCQQVAASLTDEYQPLMWSFYKSHRRALFQLVRSLPIHSTTQDQVLITALNFILTQENRRSLFVPDTLDLSFASEVWQHLIRVKRKKRTKLVRRHLEVCIFAAVADELKSGDLAVEGSERFADYRAQLLSWALCEPQIGEYCQEVSLPADAPTFVAQLHERLTEVAAQVDAAFPGNKSLEITAKGEPVLKRLKAKAVPASRVALQEALRHHMPDRSVLDVLWDTNEEVHWTRHFGPISGSDPKLAHPDERYVITSFAYGTNMGAAQMAKHMRGIVSEHEITFVNRRHITLDKLEAAKTDLINRYYQYDLPKGWGDENVAAADGTQVDLYENNLLSSYHIRYGSYGEEAVYMHIDILFKDTIDWVLLETHWTDLMQVALSVRVGKLQPSILLRKLGHESRKNRLYQAFRELGRVVRTIFLLRYISDNPLREQITKTTNIAERYNQFCSWIRFASGGLMAENDPEEMQKRVRYTDIVANALMLQTVADLTDALETLKQRGYPVQPEDVTHLSAYMTEHLQRFGEYTLKLRPVAPLADQEKILPDPPLEQSGDSEERSA